jgi:hypothetical protein
MAITKARTRLVYFRLSDEEFEQMVQLCEKTGARSLSDLSRAAIREYMGLRDHQGDVLIDTKADLSKVLEELKKTVQRLLAASKSINEGDEIAAEPNVKSAEESS